MATRTTRWAQGTPCWIDCQVDDTAAARAFYADLFGWQIEDGPAEFGGYLMAMKDGHPAAGIGPKPQGGPPMPSVWTTYLAADSADDVAASVAAAGGQAMMPPFDVADVGRMFVALDPTGAVFGVWQAGQHAGAGIFNEHGAYCWNELHTRDLPAAQEFYASVFGYEYAPFGDGYVTFALPGATAGEVVGGLVDDTVMGVPEQVPPHWLTWFQVDDTDASAARVGELGGSVVMGPADSPIGRMAVVTGTQGELFALITPQAPGDSTTS